MERSVTTKVHPVKIECLLIFPDYLLAWGGGGLFRERQPLMFRVVKISVSVLFGSLLMFRLSSLGACPAWKARIGVTGVNTVMSVLTSHGPATSQKAL